MLNKAQARELISIQRYLAHGMTDTAARALSALIRSAMKTSQRTALLAIAQQHNLASNPEFII